MVKVTSTDVEGWVLPEPPETAATSEAKQAWKRAYIGNRLAGLSDVKAQREATAQIEAVLRFIGEEQE
jgi:hypothetical protein